METPRGFALLKLGARQEAIHRPFDEVKAQLAARIGREARTKDFDVFVKKLREKASIKIHDSELDKIAVSGSPVPGLPPQSAAAAGPESRP